MNPNPWLEEQLNHEHRRELERHAEQERSAQTENRQNFWRWLQQKSAL
jgi:hypothetical protein